MDQMFDMILNEPMCLYNSRIEEYDTVDIVLFSGNQIADTEAAVRRCSYKFYNIHMETPMLESLFSPNARKYRPEKLRIRTLFTQCKKCYYERFAQNFLHETDNLKNLKKQSDRLTSCKAKFLTDNTNFKSKRHRSFFCFVFLSDNANST